MDVLDCHLIVYVLKYAKERDHEHKQIETTPTTLKLHDIFLLKYDQINL